MFRPPHPPSSLQLGRRVVVLLVCFSLGMHWVVLQGIAWTGMFLSFAQNASVIEAVEKTFDGQHGCHLCAKVKEGCETGSGQPKQPGQVQPKLAKMDAVLVQSFSLVPPLGVNLGFWESPQRLVEHSILPETPPPRRGESI